MKTAAITIVLVAAAPARAGVPLVFPHHGRLIDGDDKPVGGTADFTVRVYKKSTDPVGENNLIWEETYDDVPVTNGFYTLLVGDPDKGDALDLADWDGGEQRWFTVAVNGDAEMTPRMRIGSAPFALRAGDADTVGNRAASSFADAAHAHSFADLSVGATTEWPGTAAWARVTGAPSAYPPAAHTHASADVTDFAAQVESALAGGSIGGDLTVDGTIESTTGGIKFPDGTVQATAAEPGGGLWTESGDQISNTNAGNVGIGIATPDSKLDVRGQLLVSGSSGAGYRGFFAQGWAGTGTVIGATSGGGATRGDLKIVTNDADRIYIGVDGKVGIGTSTPTGLFDVNGKLIVDSSGAVRFPGRPAARARSTTHPDTKGYLVQANTSLKNNYLEQELFDVANNMTIDSTGARFTAPVAGIYVVAYYTFLRIVPSGYYEYFIVIAKNGTPDYAYYAGVTSQAGYTHLGFTDIVQLAAGDYIEPWESGSSTAIQRAGPTFSVYLLQ
jgi:hypothetical protein